MTLRAWSWKTTKLKATLWFVLPTWHRVCFALALLLNPPCSPPASSAPALSYLWFCWQTFFQCYLPNSVRTINSSSVSAGGSWAVLITQWDPSLPRLCPGSACTLLAGWSHIQPSLTGLERRENFHCARGGTVMTVSYIKDSTWQIANHSGFSPNLGL